MAHPSGLPEKDVTPESALSRPTRRRWLATAVAGVAGVGALGSLYAVFRPGSDDEVLATGDGGQGRNLYPAQLSPSFVDAGRALTDRAEAARYCNFYEFTSTKHPWKYVAGFQPAPWQVEVTGLVDHPRLYDVDDLVRAFPLEERIYRMRCVEAWAMTVPWTGFPLADLLRKVGVKAGAKYVRFVSFHQPEIAANQRRSFPWPYTEGLTLAEAVNELTMIVTGIYGRPLLKQHGAPVRLVVPWKYGFKSCKSITRIEVTAERPATFWNTLQPQEYGFEANVNPAIPHPRWSQETERLLGTGEVRRTVLYNGYGEWVAKLYG
jgi:sulfoxide reductase catalytic subunit YedY